VYLKRKLERTFDREAQAEQCIGMVARSQPDASPPAAGLEQPARRSCPRLILPRDL